MTPAELDALRGHTPGPWYEDMTCDGLAVESAKHGNIGLVNLARASHADAKLFAAAPALLHYVDELRANHKDLMEQLAAAQSQEVCTVAHSAEVMEFCPYCKIERLQALIDARDKAAGFEALLP